MSAESANQKPHILIRVKEEFFKELEKKTSWGKEQLKKLYIEIESKVLLEALNEKKD